MEEKKPTPGAELNSTPRPEPAEDGGVPAEPEDIASPEAEVDPTPDPIGEAPAPEPEPIQPAERMFTQAQVNELVGKTRMDTREQTYRSVYGRYGVDDEAGMDDLAGMAQGYETLRSEYDEAERSWKEADAARAKELSEIREQVALLESGIDRARFDDARAIIRAKGLEVSAESIGSELATHPEWKGAQKEERPNPNFQKRTELRVLGNEGGEAGPDGRESDEDAAMRLFGMR